MARDMDLAPWIARWKKINKMIAGVGRCAGKSLESFLCHRAEMSDGFTRQNIPTRCSFLPFPCGGLAGEWRTGLLDSTKGKVCKKGWVLGFKIDEGNINVICVYIYIIHALWLHITISISSPNGFRFQESGDSFMIWYDFSYSTNLCEWNPHRPVIVVSCSC